MFIDIDLRKELKDIDKRVGGIELNAVDKLVIKLDIMIKQFIVKYDTLVLQPYKLFLYLRKKLKAAAELISSSPLIYTECPLIIESKTKVCSSFNDKLRSLSSSTRSS